MGDPDIQRILAERLRLAQTTFEAAKDVFKETSSELPSSLPSPDSVQNIKNIGSTYRNALNAYAVASRDFHEFLLHGTVPESLKEAIRIAKHQR